MNQAPSILGLGTAAADADVSREESLALSLDHAGDLDSPRVAALYREAGVSRRGCTLGLSGMRTELLEAGASGATTRQRLGHFMAHAGALGERAARNALKDSGRSAEAITHVVTVSCTGAESPGIDHRLIELLGISPDVSRTHIGFMGCHAAINALAGASAFVRSDPDAVGLVACVDLCSLHFQVGTTPWDQQVANAIFADGAACAVVGSGSGRCQLVRFASRIFPGTEELMRWDIGDHGFQMTLSPRVPGVIKRGISDWLGSWLPEHDLDTDRIAGWAVHPGGRDILEGVRRGLELPAEALAASHRILEQQGNMSSGTILWVLSDLLETFDSGPIVGLSFGPGLTGEAVLLGK
ncbi:MAG: type III polyketide synthase [Planctomycetota bacterium]|nr:type III polyketide synthase [Planctomycetota bacterium]